MGCARAHCAAAFISSSIVQVPNAAPQVMREGSKKTVFVIFTDTVKAMNR